MSMKTARHGSSREGGRVKGQFFLLAAFFFLLVFYLGISVYLSPSFASPAIRDETSGLFENIENEYPRVANLGLGSSNPVAALADFSGIAVNAAEAHGASLEVLWIFMQNASDDLNVTVGNFLGSALNVTLNVSGEVKEILVSEGQTNSTLFTSPPSEFELRANFNTAEKNLLLEKYKASLYIFMEMRKGDDVITGEAKA
jgi:hypothetical protein